MAYWVDVSVNIEDHIAYYLEFSGYELPQEDHNLGPAASRVIHKYPEADIKTLKLLFEELNVPFPLEYRYDS